MRVMAVDPGCHESAWILYEDGEIHGFGKVENAELRRILGLAVWPNLYAADHLAIEMIASYGMPVGKEVFETCVWIGRFIETFCGPHTYVYRKDVKSHLCGSMKAKDSNIRQALLDRFGPQGTKKAKGKTYGISKDVWAALGVACTFTDTLSVAGG